MLHAHQTLSAFDSNRAYYMRRVFLFCLEIFWFVWFNVMFYVLKLLLLPFIFVPSSGRIELSISKSVIHSC